MIRAVNLGMTIDAAAIQNPFIGTRTAGEVALHQEIVWVPKASHFPMTSIAEERGEL